MKEKDFRNFKTDVVIVNTIKDESDIKMEVVAYMNELLKVASEEKLRSELIYKEQKTTEFMDYFLVYRMKLLVIISADDKKVRFNLIFILDFGRV